MIHNISIATADDIAYFGDDGNIYPVLLSRAIGEFRIIGFYLYHVISNRPSDSNGTSGLCAVLLNIDYDRGSSSYYSVLTALAGFSQCL